MQAFQEHSSTKGKESFVEVYVSTEAKTPGLPLIQNIISIDLKAGMKKGTKTFNKTEVKDAVRRGPQVSKNFTLQRVTRNAVVMALQPHAKWDYLTIQEGWQIIPRKAGRRSGRSGHGTGSIHRSCRIPRSCPPPARSNRYWRKRPWKSQSSFPCSNSPNGALARRRDHQPRRAAAQATSSGPRSWPGQRAHILRRTDRPARRSRRSRR